VIGIAFEGCACRAAFHVGAVEWLRAQGVRLQVASGASSGSMIAAAVALGLDDLQGRWEGYLDEIRLFDPRRILSGRWPFGMSDILSGALQEHFGDMLLCEVPRPLSIVVTQIRWSRGRERRVLTRADRLPVRDAILASSFIPGPYHRLVPIGGRLAVDGAWEVRTPVVEARDTGALRVIACVSNEQGLLVRGLVRETSDPVPGYARVLAPTRPFSLGGFDFDRPRTLDAFAAGREAAQVFVRDHEAWLS
jgi:predicted acylesterase/phospholipase RssA